MSAESIPALEFAPGTLLAGRLKVIRRLGEGGVGAVYEVEHQVTRHRRALKILHPKFRAMPDVVERFLREGSAAGRIGNPHIVECFDAGELEGGAPWLLMELLAGEPLSDVLRRTGALDYGPACALLVQVAQALQSAHDAGIVHRDLKPENLYLVERDGQPFVKVLDFGMSKFDSGMTGAVSMTAEGTTLGTPLYMAPEQMRGARDVDQRADVYALGVILYEALCGRTPYNAESFAELAVQVFGGGCARLETIRPDAPAGLAEVVHRAMALDPAERMQTARALAEELELFAKLPSSSGAWWRPGMVTEAGGLDRTAMRQTPMGVSATVQRTPSPMPSPPAPRPSPLRPPVPSAPRPKFIAPPGARGSAPSGEYRRAPSLERRLRRLGVVATVFIGIFVYRAVRSGSSASESAPAAVAMDDERFEKKPGPGLATFGGEKHDHPAPPKPAGGGTEALDAGAALARAHPPMPASPKPPAESHQCCHFPGEYAEEAKTGEVRIHGPQFGGLPIINVKARTDLAMTGEELAAVQQVYVESIHRVHEKLLEFDHEAGGKLREHAPIPKLFRDLKEKYPSADFAAALEQAAKERAGQSEKTSSASVLLRALRMFIEEDDAAMNGLDRVLGSTRAENFIRHQAHPHFTITRNL